MSYWFGDFLNRIEISFPGHGSTWVAEEILSRKTMTSFQPYEEKTVLCCRQIEPSPGEEAIIKAHLQIPHKDVPPKEHAQQASVAVSVLVKTEIDFLTHLTNLNCSAVPQLIDYTQTQQLEDMCLPGGYMVFILMTRLHGKRIFHFWNYDLETRDRIRETFKSSWSEINQASVCHADTGRRNLFWDEETGKCYILDFEEADFLDEPNEWIESEYYYWEMNEDEGSTEEHA